MKIPSPRRAAAKKSLKSTTPFACLLLVAVASPLPGLAASGATPAEKLTVPPGFRVELLYSPPRETEGSWVSLCVDAKGRFYASGQYDEGLWRITPPPLGAIGAATKVEKLPAALSSAQGLCWAFDSLYALVTQNAKTPSGLYRVRDSDGDDLPDQVEKLCALEGGGDHGWHALLPHPDGKSLCAIAGNNTKSPALFGARVPPHFGEDHLLPRMPDAGGHMAGVLAPGGAAYRVSPDGKRWEMVANGFRNTYDAAFDREGELFTYDADMEWDLGTPWYRPTRICHVTSGAEFGWRNGTGKWPDHFPDSLPAAVDIGPGSPTGVTFGHGAKFPPRWRDALFAADWTFGRIYAVHLRPEGASWRGEIEPFVSGVPLPVVDLVVHPDGALYFITGGWRIQTGLYRVTWTGATAKEEEPVSDTGAALRALRRELESFHGHRDPAAVDAAWTHLGHADRFLRFAARVALEWQDPATWRERALAESHPQSALTALLALARVSARDEFHRRPGEPAPDAALRGRVLAALDRLDWNSLTPPQRLELLRVHAVTFTRLGKPDDAQREKLLARFEPHFPADGAALNGELCRLLVYLQSPRAAAAALELVRRAPSQEEQFDYIQSLRMLAAGWTPHLRREYFAWFNRAAGYRGGASFAGFVRMVRDDALKGVPESERAALREILDAPPPDSPFATAGAELAGRTHRTDWTLAALDPALAGGLAGRDLARGRRLFGATGCFLCHRIDGEGGAVGPDLTRVAGRFSPRELLEATLEPSRTISDLYGNVVITRKSGEAVTGRIVYHLQGGAVNVSANMFNPAETVRVNAGEIRGIEPSPISPMPPGLLSPLTQDEILDLLAFLISGGASHSHEK